MKSEKESEHEHNILDMTHVDEYMLPGKNKDASTVNDLAYHNLDEYKYEISDSSKNVEAIKEPITDDTHIVEKVRYLQDGPTNMDPVVTGVGIIGK